MDEFLNIPLLKQLPLFTDDSNEHHWIWFDDFYGLLLKNRHPIIDTIQLKRCNVQREINGYKNGTCNVSGKLQLNILAMLRFVLSHAEDLFIAPKFHQKFNRVSYPHLEQYRFHQCFSCTSQLLQVTFWTNILRKPYLT